VVARICICEIGEDRRGSLGGWSYRYDGGTRLRGGTECCFRAAADKGERHQMGYTAEPLRGCLPIRITRLRRRSAGKNAPAITGGRDGEDDRKPPHIAVRNAMNLSNGQDAILPPGKGNKERWRAFGCGETDWNWMRCITFCRHFEEHFVVRGVLPGRFDIHLVCSCQTKSIRFLLESF